MHNHLYLLRYDWPLHFMLLLTNWMPDNVLFFRLRGALARPFFGKCGRNLRLGRNLSFHNPQKINLGSNIYISFGCCFLANDAITIEDDVIFGPYCVLASGNHTRFEGSYRYGPVCLSPITIRKGCWLSSHVVVTAGSEIGCGSLIAAGAVVKNKIDSNTLSGGIPARFIKDVHDGEEYEN